MSKICAQEVAVSSSPSSIDAGDPVPSYRGFEVIAHALAEADTTHVFAMLGAGSAGWIGYGEQQSLFAYVGMRHEAGAVAAATGFARAAGTVGVCSVNCGPGLANALGALTAAVRDRAPIVVLVSEVPVDSRHNQAQVIDQLALAAPTGAAVHRVDDVALLGAAVTHAVHSAWREQRPQLLSYGEALVDQPAPTANWTVVPDDVVAIEPEPAAVSQAVDLLLAARAPLLLAGRGVLLSGCQSDAVALAEDLGALLTTSLPAHQLFRDDPFAIGFTGGWATPATRRLVDASDCALVVGASLNSYTTNGGALLAEATVVQCDSDPEAIGRYRPVQHAVVGDARATLRAMRADLASRVGADRVGRRTPELAGQLAAQHWYDPADDLSNERGLDPRAVLHQLDRILPADRVVVSDVGRWSALLPGLVGVAEPRSLVLTLGFASIGHGLGAAIGAAHASPDRPVVLVAGDGGFLMAAQELGAVQRAGISLTVVLVDDEQFGAEVPALEGLQLPPDAAHFPGPDYAVLARAYGGRGLVVRTPAELAGLSQDAICSPGLTIVDARIDPRINARQFLRAHPEPFAQ